MKKAVFGFFIAIVALLAGVGAIYWVPDGDPAALIAKYSSPTSQFVETDDGTRIHFRDEGNPDGAVLLLVHGNNASLHTWESLVRELSDSFRLISLDLPGHGLTGPSASRDYSANGLSHSIRSLLKHLDVRDVTIVGNSMGGWLSWRYALANPEHVSGLVLISSNGAVTDQEVTP